MTPAVLVKFVLENGEGHYVVTADGCSIACDPGELSEAAAEVIEMARETRQEKER